jgi:hypothetical protein
MDITEWYAVAVGCLAFAFTCRFHAKRLRLWFRMQLWFRKYMRLWLLKHIYYPEIPCLPGMTRFHGVVLILFVATNVLCTSIGVSGSSELGRRMGTVATVNLIPLALAPHARVHRWLGRVTAVEGLVHAAMSVRRYERTSSALAGVVVSARLAGKKRPN